MGEEQVIIQAGPVGIVLGRRTLEDIQKLRFVVLLAEIFVVRIAAGKAELCLQRDIVCQPSFKTLFNRILGRIDKIIDEFKFVVVPRIFDWENLLEDLV